MTTRTATFVLAAAAVLAAPALAGNLVTETAAEGPAKATAGTLYYTCTVNIANSTHDCYGPAPNEPIQVSYSSGVKRDLILNLDEGNDWKSLNALVYLCNPTGYTMHFGDSPGNNGHGGDNGNTSHDAEAQMLNRILSIYRSDVGGTGLTCEYPNAMPASGCFWVHWIVKENFVSLDADSATCNTTGTITCNNAYLFDIGPYDEPDIEDPYEFDAYYWYAGLNNVYYGSTRSGTGVQKACFVLSSTTSPSCTTVASLCGVSAY